MTEQLDLKALERRAWRSTYEDGLTDIFLGLLLSQFGLGLWLAPKFGEMGTLGVMFVYACALVVGLGVAKKRITRPRAGTARFGTERKVKQKKVAVVLSLSMLVGAVLFAVAIAGWVSLAGWILPASVFGINAIVVFGLLAYLNDVPRFALYGWLFAGAFPAWVLIDEIAGRQFRPIAPFAFSLVMVVTGVVMLVKFVRRYDAAQADSLSRAMSHDGQ